MVETVSYTVSFAQCYMPDLLQKVFSHGLTNPILGNPGMIHYGKLHFIDEWS